VLVEAVDAVGDEPIRTSRPLSVGDREITHTLLEVRATGIDRAHRHLVAEYEREVDRVGRNLGGAIASSDTGQHEDAVFAQDLHGLEDEWREAGRLEDEIHGSSLCNGRGQRGRLRADVPRTNRFD